MRTIYFSPHLDDAILSAGGLIYEQVQAGAAVEIWTFMSGFPETEELTDFAKAMHTTWGTNGVAATVRLRRQEDSQAAALLGASVVHFDFLDCIYRRGPDGEGLYPTDVFFPPHARDADLPPQIAQAMIAWLKPEDQVVCQLAIGGHVDHVLVRTAAEMLNRPLIYDADIPYLLNHPEDLGPRTAGMQAEIQPVSEAGLERWLEAMELYASQLSSLFDSLDSMHARMRDYWSVDWGIRLWRV